MYKKQCSRCLSTSYSSANRSQWQCPYCAADITAVKARAINHSLNLSSIDNKMNQQRGLEIYRQISFSKRT